MKMNWTYTELVIEVAVAIWWFEVRVAKKGERILGWGAVDEDGEGDSGGVSDCL